MSSIKIYPPNELPQEGISDAQFEIWSEQLEIYLEIEEKFRKFLPGGKYDTWIPAEQNDKRIIVPIAPDTEDKLVDHRRDLRQFISIVAKYVHIDYYKPIIKHSSSLKWIYKKIREDYDIQTQGIHFFNLLDLTWDCTGQQTAIGFYNQYRSMIISNLAAKGTHVKWKGETLKEDDKLNTSHEDLIFLNVLQILHPKLPSYIRENYAHKLGLENKLMDFKTEILTKAKQYIAEINGNSATSINEDPQCNYMSTPRNNYRSNWKQKQQPRRYPQNQRQHPTSTTTSTNQSPPFCRICHLAGLSKTVYLSHYIGQPSCPTLSDKDKQMLTTRIGQQLGAISLEDDQDEASEILKEYGYGVDDCDAQQSSNEQVKKVYFSGNLEKNIENNKTININQNENNSNFSTASCNFIEPIPTQCLTVQDSNNRTVNLDLDTGATVSYAKLSIVKAHGFTIRPNSQLSNLADGKTKLISLGEIDEIFHRNSWSVRFHAIVTQHLHCDFVAGNNFIKENSIIQDLNAKSITIHKKYNVSETSKSLILPTEPNNLLLQNNNINIVLPQQEIPFQVPFKDNTMLAIQPWHQNKQQDWPQPQLCTVKQGKILVKNPTNELYQLKKSTKLQIRTLSDNNEYQQEPVINKKFQENQREKDNTDKIDINNEDINPDIVRYVKDINHTFKDVFNEDLSIGYNHRFGKHICRLNWAGPNRPTATKVVNINYDNETKKLLQEVCDDLTSKNVLGIPQEDDVIIQYCSPSFLVRKQKAKNKSKQDLTKDDVRLVVNFSKINDHLKNIPTAITRPKDIFSGLGKWNYIITLDLQSGFFQNHMSMEDAQWLGITTPFGGMRYLKRSGQGLIGQSEELDELLSKILGKEMKEGKVLRIADDFYIGGRDPKEAADNYRDVLEKFQAGNIKISPSKTKVFLKSVDILGWKWSQGGYLSPSPHRVNALRNTKHTDIKTVKDLRSYLGLYKTLLPASPNLTLLLNPFDLEVADRDSKETINWTRDLIASFQDSTSAVDNLQTLYLPHPEDQLLIETDAAKCPAGLGHTVYAIIEGKKLPVSFHSTKLSPNHQKWMACELEALSFATAIHTEYDLLKECKKPVILTPDSKPVFDAIKMIRKNQYSASPRIQSLITNVNRLPIIVQLASGKNKQNISSDYQSRHPSECDSEHCSVCKFVSESSDSVLIPAAINNMSAENSMTNRNAWNKIQDQQKACKEAKYLLKSGKTPSKMSGKINSEIRRLCSIAKLDKTNLLIVEKQPNKYSSQKTELIVIPQTHLPALLWQIHNKLQHPSKAQLKSNFDKSFYSVGLTASLETLYNDCFFCSSQKMIPDMTKHETITEAETPGVQFHADVLRRQSQYIFVIRDHFSSYTSSKIIKSENNQELKNAIIDTVMPLKLAGECNIRVDNATGFSPLLNGKDPDLTKLNIKITATDVLNKNANAVIDKCCYELEQELKRIEPDGRPISNTTLQIAISRLNNKLRRKGQISATEMLFNRDMYTGQNLNLNYQEIRKDQIDTRNTANKKFNEKIKQMPTSTPKPGDLVTTQLKPDKHKARDIFMVSKCENDKVTIQKVIHPHTSNPMIRSKQYETSIDRIQVTRNFLKPNNKTEKNKPVISQWNPIRKIEHDEEDDENINVKVLNTKEKDYTVHIRPQSITSTRPILYEHLDKELTESRKQASSELQKINSTEDISEKQSPRKSSRTQNKEATKKIASLYTQKQHKKIPQTDGIMTESDSSPELTDKKRLYSSTTQNLLDDETDYEDSKSQQSDSSDFAWDYSGNEEILDPDDIFPTPALDDSWIRPPLNLQAESDNVQTNRVYDLTNLLTRISTSVKNITGSTDDEPDPQKKGDANH